MPQVQTCTYWAARHAGDLSRHSSDFARRSGEFSRQSGDLTRPSGDVEELLEPILEEGSDKAFVQLLDDELERIHTFYLAKVRARLRARHCRLLSRKMQHAACSCMSLWLQPWVRGVRQDRAWGCTGPGGAALGDLVQHGRAAGMLGGVQKGQDGSPGPRQLCGSRLRMWVPSHWAAYWNPGLAC